MASETAVHSVKFTQRHFTSVAETLSELRFRAENECEEQFLDLVVQSFADTFEKDNPRFSRTRFIKACQ